MKAFLIVCLALIATSHMASAISRAEILSLLQDDYSIDKVLELFNALKGQEEQDRSNLEKEHDEREPQLATEATRTAQLLTDKNTECQNTNGLLASQKKERDNLQSNVDTATNTIEDNKNKVKTAEDARCAANLLYIGKLAQNEEANAFLDYLSQKISDPSFKEYLTANTQALLQIKEAVTNKKGDELLSILTQHHLLSMIQQDTTTDYQGDAYSYDVKGRSDAEIGTGHIDNTRGEMAAPQEIKSTIYDVDQYIQQLLSYIKELQAELKKSTDDFQAAEQKSVQALIEYRNRIKDENYVLGKYIEATSKRISELDGVIGNNEKALDECHTQAVPLKEGADLAQQNHNDYVNSYNERKKNLDNTIELLGKVIDIYTNEVVNTAGDAFKKRSDDYLEDQTFDKTGDFTSRQTNQDISNYRG